MIPGAKLKAFREARGVTLQELATALGLKAASSVYRMESNDLKPSKFYASVALVSEIAEKRAAATDVEAVA